MARPMKNSVAADVKKIGASVRLRGGEAARQRLKSTAAVPKRTKPAPRTATTPITLRAVVRVPDGKEVVRAPVAVRGPEDVVDRLHPEYEEVRRPDDGVDELRLEIAPWERQKGMHEDGDPEAAEDLAEREEELVARLGEGSQHEGEADDDHERPELVPRPAGPGDEACPDERPHDDEVQRRDERGVLLVVARERE